MPLSEQDEKRLKEIDSELEKIHKDIKEYHSRTDEHGVTWQTPWKTNEYQTLVDRELELLTERMSIIKRS
ncbi:hypothetical protein ACFLX3_02785 [Chloroflexota bacterium]